MAKKGAVMSARDKFQRELAENLEKEMYGGVVAADNVSTGVFDGILQQLLDAALDILMNCLNSRNKQDIASSLGNPGPFERAAIRKAIRDNATMRPHRQPCYNALITTLKDTPPQDVTELVENAETFRGFTI